MNRYLTKKEAELIKEIEGGILVHVSFVAIDKEILKRKGISELGYCHDDVLCVQNREENDCYGWKVIHKIAR